MTISSTPAIVQYQGDNVSVTFTVPFYFQNSTDLVLTKRSSLGVDAVLVIGTDYAVTGAGNTNGGSVTLNVAPKTGAPNETLTIVADPIIQQQTHYLLQGLFPSTDTENALDLLTRIAQVVRRKEERSIRAPDADVNPVMALPSAAIRGAGQGTFPHFAAGGGDLELVTAISGVSTPLSQSIIGSLLDPQTAGEAGGGVTPVSYRATNPILDMRRFMTGLGTGLSINAAITAALSAGYRTIWLPAGQNLLTNVSIAVDNVTFLGDGESSRLTVGANNSRLWNVTGQNFRVIGMRLEGDGTTADSITGVAAYLNGAGGAMFEDCLFTGFGFGALSGAAASSLLGPKLNRCKFRATGAAGTDVYMGGQWRDTLMQDCDSVQTIAGRALLLFDNATTGWQGLTVRGGYYEGHQLQAIAATDENPAITDRVWSVLVDGARFKNVNWSGVKLKQCLATKVVNNIFDGCTIAAEDLANGLYGDILCNGMGKSMIAHNTHRNSGTEAIRSFVSTAAGATSTPDGVHRNECHIHDNLVDGTGITVGAGGNGITVLNGYKQVLIHHNTIRNCNRVCINIPNVATAPCWDVGIFHNSMVDNPNATNSISASFGHSIRMDGNLTQNGPATGVVVSDFQHHFYGPTDAVLDPVAVGGRGYQIGGNSQDIRFYGKAGNTTYAAWVALTGYTLGQRIANGANVYECITAGTSGNAGGPVHTAGSALDPGSAALVWQYVHKYLLMPYGLRLVGTPTKTFVDGDFTGCTTGPFEALIAGAGGLTATFRTSIQTTTAALTSIFLIPMPDATAFSVEYKVTANANNVPDRAMYHLEGLYFRTGGGNVTIQGALTNITTIESNAAWDATLTATTTNLAGRVTGAVGATANWNAECTLRSIT